MASRTKHSVESNIVLIKEVQKHKCLYDFNLESYTDRHAQNAAWKLIATKLNLDAEDCKFRWKNLRGGLTRYLKNLERKGPHDPTLTKYYLLDSMQFLVEFTRAEKITKRKKTDAINKFLDKSANNADSEDTESSEDSVYMEELNLDSNHDVLNQPEDPTVDPLAIGGTVTSSKTNSNGIDEVMSNSHDMDFFKSILPDISNFSMSQKRKFKQKVLKIIEKISKEKGRRYKPY